MELHGFDESNQNTKKSKVSLPHIKLTPKSIMILIAVLAIGVGGIFASIKQNKEKQIEQQEQEIKDAEEQELQEKLSEAHSAANYYLNEVQDAEWTNTTVAILVAHVLDTGCTEAFEILRNYFDADSMEYLYNFVSGSTCAEFNTPPYVLQEVGSGYEDYKIKFNAKTQYLMRLYLTDEGFPKNFVLMYYDTRHNILSESENSELSEE